MATSEVPAGAGSPGDRARAAMIGGEAEKVQESAKVAARRRTELLEACVKGMDNVRRTAAVGAAERVLASLVAGDPHDEHRHTTNALLAVSIAEGEHHTPGARHGVIHGIRALARSNAEAHLRMELAGPGGDRGQRSLTAAPRRPPQAPSAAWPPL